MWTAHVGTAADVTDLGRGGKEIRIWTYGWLLLMEKRIPVIRMSNIPSEIPIHFDSWYPIPLLFCLARYPVPSLPVSVSVTSVYL